MFELKEFLRNKGMDVSNIDEMAIRSDASILNMILKDNPSGFPYFIFDENAWNDENINLYFKNVKNIYSLLSGFRTSKAMLIALDCNRVDILTLFTADLINDEVENKYVEKCEQGLIKFIISTFCTSNILRKLLNKNLLHHASLMAKNSSIWTDDCVNLFCQKLDSYQGSLEPVDIMYLSQLHNNKIIYALLKNKYYDIVIYIDRNPSLLDDSCKQLLIDNLDDYLKTKNIIPNCLINNEYALYKRLIEHKLDYIGFFNEDAWSDKNLELFFKNNPQISNVPHGIQYSTKAFAFLLKNNYYHVLNFIYLKNVSDVIIKLYLEKCKEDNIEILPIALRTSDVLKQLIEHNLLYQASLMPKQFWNDELIDAFCKQVDNYQGTFSYFVLRELKTKNILQSFIKNKRYDMIGKIYDYGKDVWDEDVINMFIEHIPLYLNTFYSLPVGCYKSSAVLKKVLEIKKYRLLNDFKDETWTEENLYLYIQLMCQNNKVEILRNISEEKRLFLQAALYGTQNVYEFSTKEAYNNLLKYAKNMKDDSRHSKEYQAFAKFIYQTNSFSIYLLILSLIKNDFNNLNNYFNESGPTDILLAKLIYNKDYQVYCQKNNIDLLNNTDDVVLLQYLKITQKYPDIFKYIYIDQNNLNNYFDNDGPKKELIDCLFNNRAAAFLYNLNIDLKMLDSKRELILKKYASIDEAKLKEVFFNYCFKYLETIQEQDIDRIYLLLKQMENSNSSEIRHFKTTLAEQLLLLDNPEKRLNEIEDIFLKNNLPDVAKFFLTFKIMYPNYTYFSFDNNSTMCPTLKKCNDIAKDVVIFTKLLYAQLGSNNLALMNYIDSLVNSNQLYQDIISHKIDINNLNEEQRYLLDTFKNYLQMLYNSSLIGKKNGLIEINSLDDIKHVLALINPSNDESFNVPDRIVHMFCHNAGFDTVESIRKYSVEYLKKREEYHKRLSKQGNFILKKGNLVKGIGQFQYLDNTVKYGVRCREVLGDSAGSDRTQLDTDLAIIPDSYSDNYSAINATCAKGYGNTFLVFKVDERFNITRGDDMVDHPVRRNSSLIELFKTGVIGETHYGIGIAAAFSDVDYIVTKEYSKNMGLILAINGVYVPIVDMQGKLLFPYEEYTSIREKMNGLSHYGIDKYNLANDIVRDDLDPLVATLSNNDEDTSYKRSCILKALQNGINMVIKTSMDGDLTPGSIEILDTGSTGRGTNVPGDGDFDFIVRVDRSIMIHEEQLSALKKQLAHAIGREYEAGDFRFENVSIPGLDQPVDIDMSFIAKTNKMDYSTEMCIVDRLTTIKKQSPEQYDYVVANIIMAKKLFKQYGCYKPKHAGKGKAQGGLGGIGVENWILQNGGSLMQAANSFIECAKGKTFEEFKNSYPINDFGANHMAEKRGSFPYDNYIFNLDKNGYENILVALNDYVLGKVHFEEEEYQK